MLTNETIKQYFSHVDTNGSSNSAISYGPTFVATGSRTLVVTAGDSWTWGFDMTVSNNHDHRMSHSFGSIVAKELNADWLNLAQTGSGNFWLLDKIKEFAKLLPSLDYDKVYVICTLTEPGRAFNSNMDRHIDYITWFKNNTDDPSKLLPYLNNLVVSGIIDTLSKFDITLRIGTNFVNQTGLEVAGEYLVPDTWLEILNGRFVDECFVVSPFVINELKSAIDLVEDKNKFLTWIIELSDKAILRRKQLIDPIKFANGHPIAQSHKMWADYILTKL